MSVPETHVAIDQLTALAFVSRAPMTAQAAEDQTALVHVSQCDQCAAALHELVIASDGLRDKAFADADKAFDDIHLDAQRMRILDRLALLGRSARVLRFPERAREYVMPAPTSNRRWVTAAAAGLIIGLVTGQLLHLAPTGGMSTGADTPTMRAPAQLSQVRQAAADALSDDDLLYAVDNSVQLRRARSLQALDALTPVAADFRDLGQ